MKHLMIRGRFLDLTGKKSFRIILLFLGYIFLIILRKRAGVFGISLGYLYISLISLAGFWYGIKGGVLAALVSSTILFLEVNIFRYWAFRDLVMEGIFLRILVYFLGGIGIGYVSQVERGLREKLKGLAYYDELTGCINFRWVMHILERETARCKRYNKEMTVIMVDIDHFKRINDRYGHIVGNDVLKGFAKVIRDNVRSVDIVGRYGGEEFLIILPEAKASQGYVLMERIRKKFRYTLIESAHLKGGISIRFSAGIASFPYNTDEVGELIKVVDRALYQAKSAGRDRIVVERRRWIRVDPPLGLKIEIGEISLRKRDRNLKVINVSQRGALFFSSYDFLSDMFPCRVYLSNQSFTGEYKCKVIHKSKLSTQLYKVGVYFEDKPIPIKIETLLS